MQKYSHRSNGNCQCQNCRNKAKARYDEQKTGSMSNNDMMKEGVTRKESFERRPEDFIMYSTDFPIY